MNRWIWRWVCMIWCVVALMIGWDLFPFLEIFDSLVYAQSDQLVWATLDNSLVLWEVFFLNVSIFRMWQIMRNFANFALWWLFLYALLRNIFVAMSGNEDYLNGERWVKKILPKLLLAAIFVQSSFFLMSAMIDLSTLAIYSIWTLPGTVATGADTYFIPCLFTNNIIAEEGAEDGSVAKTWNQHKKNYAESRASLVNKSVSEIEDIISDDYCAVGNSLIDIRADKGEPIDMCKLAYLRQDVPKADGGWIMAEYACPTMADFMTNAAGMTGPMYGLLCWW